ncbi:hypothetical protein HZH66_010244 [Vespula vulgaris]|uniref:Uncharacterized protein n=1 Tax=Vespula vulgaris TaxID=7454 RepID=A0A834JJL2_VESVU|nr:hypothetical protein HZH66_010244 [Vespula vulgaris]
MRRLGGGTLVVYRMDGGSGSSNSIGQGPTHKVPNPNQPYVEIVRPLRREGKAYDKETRKPRTGPNAKRASAFRNWILA